MLAYVPAALMLAGLAAYTVLAGADFGAGLWTLLPVGRAPVDVTRDHARHAMGPVWEANHVWLIFVLTVCWTAYPVAFGSIMSTLAAPLLIAAIGIIFRGATYALRGLGGKVELLFALSSVLTPFALGTVAGAIALGRVPVGNASGNPVTSWLAPGPILIGVLAVVFSGYLAAVYLAADSLRQGSQQAVAADFRDRALISGFVAGGLAVAGLAALRSLPLTHGLALAMVIVSTCAGAATLALCWRWRFGLARLTAAVAVATVVAGWAAAQSPRFLPGLTVSEAAAGRTTLVALLIAIAAGALVLIPSLTLLFTLFLRGHLDAGSAPPIGVDGPPTPSIGAKVALTPKRPGARVASTPMGLGAGAVGAGLLVFADAAWAQAIGVVSLVTCAVIVFWMASRAQR